MGEPTQPDAYVDVIQGPCELKPDIAMSMKADVAHAFWHGKVNLAKAMTTKKIIAKGPIPKILKLLPAIKSLYAAYPEYLKEIGRADLVLA